MEPMYRSTRSEGKAVTASQAILKGLAEDGGLFVPTSIPALDKSFAEIAGLNYQETAYEVMKKFFTDFSEEELKENQKKRTVEEVRPPKKTEKPVQTEEEKLSELLESHVYNEEQLGEIMLAIGAGISYDKILQMADTKNSAEKMKEIRKKFTKETASD